MSDHDAWRPPATSGILAEVDIRGFRSVRQTTLTLSPVCALVGEPEAGKSNLLAAIRALLDPASAALSAADLLQDGDSGLEIHARLASGASLQLKGTPPNLVHKTSVAPPPALYLPAQARAGALLAPTSGAATDAADHAAYVFKHALGERLDPAAASSSTAPATAAVEVIEACCAEGLRGVVLLMEEPELYLRPQGQRYLYRLLRHLAAAGNQVIYSTHSPAFLNAARLGEVTFVERAPEAGTSTARPDPVTPDADFRILSEFDAERSELLLARAAVLVEGLTEKLALPFVFAALAFDHDREGITIVECGGKANIPLYARVCQAAGVPFVAVHDRDALPGRRPRASERALNAEIAAVSGRERTVVLEPDFEGLAHLRRSTHKPEQAWRRFASLEASRMPEPLLRAARIALELARSGSAATSEGPRPPAPLFTRQR